MTALATSPRFMDPSFIRVSQDGEMRWSVLRGPRAIALLNFRLKSHAIAYARAISLSNRLALFVDDDCGMAIKQEAATLTYPRVLN